MSASAGSGSGANERDGTGELRFVAFEVRRAGSDRRHAVFLKVVDAVFRIGYDQRWAYCKSRFNKMINECTLNWILCFRFKINILQLNSCARDERCGLKAPLVQLAEFTPFTA